MIEHEKAMKLWNKIIGKSNTRAIDYKDREIRKESYGDRYSEYGWNVHHKIPERNGGTNAFDNLLILHFISHDEIHGKK